MKKILQVNGMTCAHCESRIENALNALNGVQQVSACYAKGSVTVQFDESKVDLNKMINIIERLDYRVASSFAEPVHDARKKPASVRITINQALGVGIIVLAVYLVIKHTIGFNFIPQVEQNMGYGLLFVIGLTTSLHCIAMCGGINLSQCVSYRVDEGSRQYSKLAPSVLYNAGRVLSYTVIGGIVGALGSVVSFSGTAKGIVAIFTGLFMVIMGINMLNIFPWLRRFNPRMPKFFGRSIEQGKANHGPFYVGLFNGLMPCGPLQAMQLYALGTGSFTAGALSMLVFSLGTVPLMFGFGALSSLLSSRFTKNMMKISGVLVVVLGLVMAGRGLNLSGISIANATTPIQTSSPAPQAKLPGNVAKVEGKVQTITTKFQNGRYTPFTVQKGIPVKWTIRVTKEDLNGCNNPVTIPKYNITKRLVPGDNVIEFTPAEEGNITYTCWMGMVSSTIKVVPDLSNTTAAVTQETPEQQIPAVLAKGGCCVR